MFVVDNIVLLVGVLLALGIASSKLSARAGMPVLVLFLAIGMLAGSEGVGRIDFENYTLAHAIGTVALVYILFDGGLRTERSTFRAVLWPSAWLATVGVVITAGITGLVAAYVLDLPLLHGLLLGSIVGSTDAAAVFAVLRSAGVRVSRRLSATLELESASNDPMAIFLTVACIELVLGRVELGPQVLWLFLWQMLAGAVIGLLIGRGGALLYNRIALEAAGLYPVLTGAIALLAYGVAAVAGASGFLAVYLAGIVLGNSNLVFRRGVLVFHDGLAWLSQIVMFVVLGLLSFPSRLLDVAGSGLLVVAALMFMARPAAVLLCVAPFRFKLRESVFLMAGGLKGAVPIVLATYPLMHGVPQAGVLFDVVFLVALISAAMQGWSLPLVARALGLERPGKPRPPVTLEITSLRDVDGDIVEYTLTPESRASGQRVRELALPSNAVIALVARESQFIPPRGSTRLLEGDHVFVVLQPRVRWIVDLAFTGRPTGEAGAAEPEIELHVRPTTRVGDLAEQYGVRVDAPPERTLAELLEERLGHPPAAGDRAALGSLTLFARDVTEDGRVETVGVISSATVDPNGAPGEQVVSSASEGGDPAPSS